MKHYDFNPDSRMTPTIGLLHSMVVYNYERLKSMVEGLNQDAIDYKGPNGELNSIAQLLRHLAVVDLHWVFRLQSKLIPLEYQERFGPMYDSNGKLPEIKGIPLHNLLAEYDEIQELFKQVCLEKTDKDLNKVVPFDNDNGYTATTQWGIWHIADHSRHHYANIVQLKKKVQSLTNHS